MIKIFNDLENVMQDFKPIKENEVTMYVCGVTVYDSPHLGHAYSAVAFDIIRRYLEYRKYHVKYVMNYTDVDDKMIKRANEKNTDIFHIAQKYIDEYERMQKILKIKTPTIKPRATEEIPDIIKMIQDLEKKGYVYESEGSVYFDTSKLKGYKNYFRKKLSKEDDIIDFTHCDFAQEKRNIEDFVLWKKKKDGEPFWSSPWGEGRPGWHIECSVMAIKYLGNSIDIHGGGKDLCRPHHQNEIAQSECATGSKFVNYWIHNGFLNVDNQKMGKSLGNFIPLNEMLDKFSGTFLRYYFATAYYRTPINFSMDKLEEGKKNLNKIQIFYKKISEYTNLITKDENIELYESQNTTVSNIISEFHNAMDQDFNTAKAMGYFFALINYISKDSLNKNLPINQSIQSSIVKFLLDIDNVFKFIVDKSVESNDSESIWKNRYEELIIKLLDFRKNAKKKKKYDLADSIRDLISETGIVINDMGEDYSYTIN